MPGWVTASEPEALDAGGHLECASCQQAAARVDTPRLPLAGQYPGAGHVPARGPYRWQRLAFRPHARSLVGDHDVLARHRRRPDRPAGLEAPPQALAIHVHAIEKHSFAEDRAASEPELAVQVADDGRAADLQGLENRVPAERKGREQEPGRGGIVRARRLGRSRVIAIPPEVAHLIRNRSPEQPAVRRDSDVPARGKPPLSVTSANDPKWTVGRRLPIVTRIPPGSCPPAAGGGVGAWGVGSGDCPRAGPAVSARLAESHAETINPRTVALMAARNGERGLADVFPLVCEILRGWNLPAVR